jgi:sulfate adenylyltransferase
MRNSQYPKKRGFTVFLTGFSAAGKTSTAQALRKKLMESSTRLVTVLDGDEMRKLSSAHLGFSKQDRDTHIRRMGSLAADLTRNGGACVCAAIAPYDAIRKELRTMIEPHGGFFLVHIATPLATCESRDPEGLYAKARDGSLSQFTGISDPYEAPTDAEIVLDCSFTKPNDAAENIIRYIRSRGYF